METVTDFMFLGSNITADGNCSHDTERCFFIGRKAVANLDSILKRRHITLLTMVHIVKAVILLVVMYGCASWTIKKAECQRIDAFDLWCWRRLLRFPWKARRSIQSILKEMSFRYLLEEQMPKLKLQSFGQLMWRVDSLENTLMLGKIEGRRKRGGEEDEMVGRHHQFNGHEFVQLQKSVKDREAWHAAVHGVEESQKWLSDWTTINIKNSCTYLWL